MPARLLVEFDGSSASRAVLLRAARAASQTGAKLTVIALARTERPSRCCNQQTTFWNAEMRRVAAESLQTARALLDDPEAQFIVREGWGRLALITAAQELDCDVIAPQRRGEKIRRRLRFVRGSVR